MVRKCSPLQVPQGRVLAWVGGAAEAKGLGERGRTWREWESGTISSFLGVGSNMTQPNMCLEEIPHIPWFCRQDESQGQLEGCFLMCHPEETS